MIAVATGEELLPGLSPLLDEFARQCPTSAIHAKPLLVALCRPWLERIISGRPLPRSRLTPDGYPFEFIFGSRSADISYTAEPELADASAKDKWQFVRKLDPDLDPLLHPLLRKLIAEPSQRFGCWLSVRHRHDTTAFKVYQEVADPSRDLVLNELRLQLGNAGESVELEPRLVAFVSVPTGPVEYYCRLINAGPAVLHGLFSAAGVAEYVPAVINYLVYLAAEERSKLWKRLRLGVSFGVSTDGVLSVTVFAHGCQLFPTNEQARTRLLGLARQLDSQMTVYERITARFEKAAPPYMLHGMVGLKINKGEGIECAVGVRPF